MKALIKRYPDNAEYEYESEVYLESAWHPWIDRDTGAPLTDENYGYALCVECPDDVELKSEDFEIVEKVEQVEDEFGEKIVVRSWTAEYVGGVE